MSPMGYSFIGGLLEHAEALAAVACPTVNSYKRLASAAARTRARRGRRSYATYGGNDRTHMLRVPDAGPGRGPLHRRVGQSVPHHERAHRCGLDGMERAVDPGDPCELNLLKHRAKAEAASLGLRSMPMTLWHALEHLEGDDVLRAGLGKTPDGDYVDYFVATKRDEVRASHAAGHAVGARPVPRGLLMAPRTHRNRPD